MTLAKFLLPTKRPAMRTALSPVMLLSLAIVVCADAQQFRPAPKPDLNFNPAQTSPVAASPEKEPKLRSELPIPGTTQQFSTGLSRYEFLLAEAMRRFQVRDFKGATGYLDRADEVLPPTARSLNVRGAIAIELREFDRGYKYCEDALKVEPGFFPARFNICEIPFLKGNYPDARQRWQQLLGSKTWSDATTELVTYRIFLTYILENDLDQAKEWLEKIRFPSHTPAYQYANAVMARKKGNMAGWNEWLRSATYIWPEMKRSQFVDVLIQLGWLKQE